jgi:hypothetical protein
VEENDNGAVQRPGCHGVQTDSAVSKSEGIERDLHSRLDEIAPLELNNLLLKIIAFVRMVFPFADEAY